MPDQPVDLADHDGLLANEIASTWRLHRDAGREVAGTPRFRMAADESMMLLGAALRARLEREPACSSRRLSSTGSWRPALASTAVR